MDGEKEERGKNIKKGPKVAVVDIHTLALLMYEYLGLLIYIISVILVLSSK